MINNNDLNKYNSDLIFNSPQLYQPQNGGFNPNLYNSQPSFNQGSWWDRAWNKLSNNLGSFYDTYKPKDLGQVGSLISAGANIWDSYEKNKRAREALEVAKDNLNEQKRIQRQKEQNEKDFSNTIKSVWNRS